MCTQPLDGVSNLKGSCVWYRGCCSLVSGATLLFRPWARPQFITIWANSYSTRKPEIALRVCLIILDLSSFYELSAIGQASQSMIANLSNLCVEPRTKSRSLYEQCMRKKVMHSLVVLAFRGKFTKMSKARLKISSRILAAGRSQSTKNITMFLKSLCYGPSLTGCSQRKNFKHLEEQLIIVWYLMHT